MWQNKYEQRGVFAGLGKVGYCNHILWEGDSREILDILVPGIDYFSQFLALAIHSHDFFEHPHVDL
jgi:hypothetical protein